MLMLENLDHDNLKLCKISECIFTNDGGNLIEKSYQVETVFTATCIHVHTMLVYAQINHTTTMYGGDGETDWSMLIIVFRAL